MPNVRFKRGCGRLTGTIRKDPSEKVFYIGVEDVSSKLAEVVERGGSIDRPRFEVPGVVVLGLFKDPAGNRVGLVKMVEGLTRLLLFSCGSRIR